MIPIEILSAITEAVLGYVLDQSGLADKARQKLKREPTHLAFQRALGKAAETFERQYPEQWASLGQSHLLCKVSKDKRTT